jgi:hypothetical protein
VNREVEGSIPSQVKSFIFVIYLAYILRVLDVQITSKMDILYTLKIYVERCDIRTDIQRTMDDQNIYPIVENG